MTTEAPVLLRVTPADVMNGVLYSLAKRGYQQLSSRGLLPALHAAYAEFKALSPAYGLAPSFGVVADPSEYRLVGNALNAAVSRGAAYYAYSDNTLMLDRTLRLVRMENLPGAPEIYVASAERAICVYNER